MNDAVCKCGHSQGAHEHYRRGSDCAICGAESCRHFRRDRAAKSAPLIGTTPLPDPVRLVPPLAEPVETIDLPTHRRVG